MSSQPNFLRYILTKEIYILICIVLWLTPIQLTVTLYGPPTTHLGLNRLPKLEQITCYQINEFMHRYNNKHLPTIFENYLTPISTTNPYCLLSSDNYMHIYGCNKLHKFSIKCVGPNNWNKIPLEICYSGKFSTFKIKLKKTIFCLNRTDHNALTTVVN